MGSRKFTPLTESLFYKEKLGVRQVQLKMECFQPTGSFKDRGMSLLCDNFKKSGGNRIVSSSGGNAGLAAAFAAKSQGMAATVIVPSTTKQMMVQKLQQLGAEVEVHGKNWNEADLRAREICARDDLARYAPPFDHKDLWTGHSTIIDEIFEQRLECAPDYIVASVGGGGLLAGILHGLARYGREWTSRTKVIAAETEGAASMAAALKAKELVKISSIDSLATSLGALQVSQDSLDFALKHEAGCQSAICSDKEAIQGCLNLLDNHRVLVEPACGTAIAGTSIFLQDIDPIERKNLDIVIVVCGGSAISFDLLTEFKQKTIC